MQLRVFTTTILLTTIGLVCASPSFAQIDLNAELKQALCNQNWGKAIEILDKMKAAAPQSADEIVMYRSRLDGLINSGVQVLNWPSYCSTDKN